MAKKKQAGEFDALNAKLAEISGEIYGKRLRLELLNPKDKRIRPMDKNARFMERPMFEQLVENIQKDGQLESVPLLHELKNGTLEIISGHHRIDAAKESSVPHILVMIIPEELKLSEKRAKQISHNAISGEDDIQILASMWVEIGALGDKIYTGLDAITIEELEKIKYEGLNPEALKTEMVVIWFLPEEVELLDYLLEKFEIIANSDKVYLAPLKKYKALFDALVSTKNTEKIKNTAVAFGLLIERVAAMADFDAMAKEMGNKDE